MLASCALGTGCGSKTALPVPCTAPLAPAPPTVVVVIDHSNSAGVFYQLDMTSTGQRGYYEFGPMIETVEQCLAAMPEESNVGLYVYPNIVSTMPVNVSPGCHTPSALAIPIAPGNPRNVMPWLHQYGSNDGSQFANLSYQPSGGAPVHAALTVAGDALATVAGTPSKFIVLVGNSPPDCNSEIALADCTCYGAPGDTFCWHGGNGQPPVVACSDLIRAVATVRSLRAAGVQTLVIGDDLQESRGTRIPWLEAVWTDLADAGGLARNGDRHWYGVRERTAIQGAIRTQIVATGNCELHVVGPHPDLDGYELLAGRVGTVPFDTAHIDGWDWIDIPTGRLRVFGSSCERLIAETPGMFLRHPTRQCELTTGIGDRE